MTTYARRIGVFSGTLFVVGGIIGSGVFLNPAVVAQRVGTGQYTMLAWGLGAVIAILGAFIFAELGARAPSVGGGYAYLRDAFGPLPAFLYGWALLLAIASGATAAVAVTFANYAVPLLGLGAGSEPALAITAIGVFTVINILGVAPGAVVQNVFTVLKLAAIAMLIIVGLFVADAPVPAVTVVAAAPLAVPHGFVAVAVALGTALVPVLFAYGGWQQTNFVAEEMVDPRRQPGAGRGRDGTQVRRDRATAHRSGHRDLHRRVPQPRDPRHAASVSGDLLDWVTFADWIFFGLTAATLIVYRRREASGTYFLAPFHPWSTGLFMVAAAYVVLGAIVSNPMNALRGTLVLAAGVPVYLWWRRGQPEPDTGEPSGA